ncbi:NfrA family protein [Vibrio quintilis]|nr:hypothetical protein [Vibrio quintilis]
MLSWQALAVDNIYHGLTQFQQFRVYPYVDKAFAFDNSQQYQAAQAELDKALYIEPEAVGLLQYALELGIKMQLPEEALIGRLNKIPAAYRNEPAFLLAMATVKHGRLLSEDHLKLITADLTTGQYSEVCLTNLYALEKKSGEQVALSWSESLPETMKTDAIFRYQAHVYFKRKHHALVIGDLRQIPSSHLTLKDKLTLALSYIEVGQDQAYKNMLADAGFSVEEMIQLKRRYIGALVYQGRQLAAKQALLELKKITSLTEEEAAQLAYIYQAEAEDERQAELAASCLARVEMQLQSENMPQAKKLMADCDPATETSRWINYVQIMGVFPLLEKVRFSGENEVTRNRLLTDYYTGNNQWQQIIRLLSSSPPVESQSQVASAYAHLKLYRQAAQTWMKLFERTGKISYLNLATYQAEKLRDKLLVKSLFDAGIRMAGDALFTHAELRDRLTGLIIEHLILFEPEEVDRLNTLFAGKTLSPALWERQHLCDRLSGRTYQAPFLIKASAYCLAGYDLAQATRLYQQAAQQQQDSEDIMTLAVWHSRLGQHQAAEPYWDMLETTVDSGEEQRYLHTQALLDNHRIPEAEALWQRYKADSLRWELLAAELAERMDDQTLAYQRYHSVFRNYDSPIATNWLFRDAENDTAQLSRLTEEILKDETKINSAAEAAYLMTEVDPQQAGFLFRKAASVAPYNEDSYFNSAFADVAKQNGHKRLAQQLYRDNTDRLVRQVSPETQLLAYQQQAYRDLDVGWKFSVAGWLGHSKGATTPGLSGRAGDYFVREEAKYFIDSPPLTDSAFFIAMQHSQVFDSGANDFSSSELDAGYQFRLLPELSYYFDLGVRQSLNSDSYTRPYVRLKADVFSRDEWSKAWQTEADSWLYHNLYIDMMNELDNTEQYSLYGRYSLGKTYKLREVNRHRLTPYLFAQWGRVYQLQPDERVGGGISWRWEFNRNLYKGYGTIAEVGAEWQHLIDPQPGQHGESYLLRFSFFF